MQRFKYIREGKGIPPAAGAYSPAIVAGDTCFVSGQIALLPTGQLAGGDAAEQTKIAMANIIAILDAADLGLENVVMVQILLADVRDFPAVNQVYASMLPHGHFPARVTSQAGALPLGALVEIQVTAIR